MAEQLDPVGTDSATAADRLRHHLTEMEAWLDGRLSHTNRISQGPCSPELSGITEAAIVQADAQQAAAHAAAAQAYATVLVASFGPRQ